MGSIKTYKIGTLVSYWKRVPGWDREPEWDIFEGIITDVLISTYEQENTLVYYRVDGSYIKEHDITEVT